MWLKAHVLSSNKYKREDLVLVTPNCFLCDCKVCTEEENREDGKRLGRHSIFRILLVPVAAPREPSVAARPLDCMGPTREQVESGSHFAGPGERQSSRRGRQEKNSGVQKKCKEEEFMCPRAVPFWRDALSVRVPPFSEEPHPVCCLEHQKDVRASKLQPDGS